MKVPGWVPAGPITIGTTAPEFPSLEPPSGSRPGGDHLVALAWVFDADRRHILLVSHRRAGWSCPGGHVEVGEHPLAAARRELEEETGLAGEPVAPSPLVLARSVGCARSGPETVHWAAGYAFVCDPAIALAAEPGQPARWFEVDDLPPTRTADIDLVVWSIGAGISRR